MKSITQVTTAIPRDDKTKGLLLGIPIIIALLFVYIAVVGLYKARIPEHVDDDTVSVSVNEYEEALAKWRSRNVTEYEITVSTGDLITLRVVPGANEVYLLKHVRSDGTQVGSPNPDVPTQESVYLSYTVEALFNTLKQRLNLVQSDDRIQPAVGDTDYYHDLVVKLDLNLGYPSLLEEYVRHAHRAREITWREKLERTIEVKNLTILR